MKSQYLELQEQAELIGDLHGVLQSEISYLQADILRKISTEEDSTAYGIDLQLRYLKSAYEVIIARINLMITINSEIGYNLENELQHNDEK